MKRFLVSTADEVKNHSSCRTASFSQTGNNMRKIQQNKTTGGECEVAKHSNKKETEQNQVVLISGQVSKLTFSRDTSNDRKLPPTSLSSSSSSLMRLNKARNDMQQSTNANANFNKTNWKICLTNNMEHTLFTVKHNLLVKVHKTRFKSSRNSQKRSSKLNMFKLL